MEFAQPYLLIFNLFAIFAVWLRIESRLSRLEGRFDQFMHDKNNPGKEVKTDGSRDRSIPLH